MLNFVFYVTRKWQKITDVSVIFSFPALCPQKAWMHVDDPCVSPGVQRRALGGWMIRRMLLVQFFFFFCTLKEQIYTFEHTHFKTFYSLSLVQQVAGWCDVSVNLKQFSQFGNGDFFFWVLKALPSSGHAPCKGRGRMDSSKACLCCCPRRLQPRDGFPLWQLRTKMLRGLK